ncbi:MFS transporter [Sphingomonas sp. AP4-R1]|uniref:MFS transporter n=1 Tax=Sphingomonas sp. AP4-R1 TaxID=2735134 RepID=UPI001493CF0D|nr:MFS transporter [Sphingomonas sp. AP4-R1]QJU57364.1 MFS transporter [Sphingomonas sp. AP4-R1]
MGASTATASSAGYAAFAHPEFRLFFFARLANNLGTNIMLPALGWQIYALTHDALAIGIIGAVTFVPVAIMTLPSGQIADRLERRAVYRSFQIVLGVGALILLGLSLAGIRAPLGYYAVAALFGAAKTFSAPAASAWMPHLVSRRDFPNAVAWISSAFQLTNVAGPAVAGLMLYVSGTAAAYGFAASSYFASFVLASLIATRSRGGDTRRAGLGHLFGGLTYIWKSRLIFAATTLDLFAVLFGGATALLPIYADQVLHVGASGFGVLRSAPAVGAALTGLYLAHRPLRSRVGAFTFIAVAVFGLMTILFGLSRWYLLSVAALIILGGADMMGAFIRSTLVQLVTHDDMRGRVSAVNMVFSSARNELGDMQSGFAASLIGVVPATVAGGGAALGVAALWAWRYPVLRRIDRFPGMDAETETPSAS